MGLEFRRNGRKLSNRQFFDGIRDDVLKDAEKDIERRLRSVRDPATGQPLKFSKIERFGKTEWNIEGSPEAMERAKRIVEEG